jgi:hypothetical protein
MKILRMVSEALRIGVFAMCRIGTVVAVMWIVVVIYVAVEIVLAVEPWAGSDENAATEPLGAIVAIGGALIRRIIVVAVGANRRCSDGDGYLGRGSGRCGPHCTSQSG